MIQAVRGCIYTTINVGTRHVLPLRIVWMMFMLSSAAVVSAPTVSAHANLQKAYPAANEALLKPPASIDLAFTEPLEPAFSTITLRDVKGLVVETPSTQFDAAFPNQMFIPLYERAEPLPDGLYTVAWRAVSAADGHATSGSYAFGINVMVERTASTGSTLETITTESVVTRWLHLLAASLTLGGLGFWLFVWQPSHVPNPPLTGFYRRFLVIGWLLWGAALVLILMLQTSLTTGGTFWGALLNSGLGTLLTQTTFGGLWLMRSVLWVIFGVCLWRERLNLALGVGLAILFAHSLFSHANATQDPLAAAAGQWLHLIATTLWIGGLGAFMLTLWIQRRELTAVLTGQLVARFSNYARVAVMALIVTGAYAAWLHVGSLDALLTTVYGQALVIKLSLFAPVLIIAGVNLVWTQRRLNAGQAVWVGRLRGLVGVEIVLALGILSTAAVLTSGSPARGVQALRQAEADALARQGYFGMETAANNGQMTHLEVKPGTVGENEFIVMAYDAEGKLITDAALIRLRFEHLDQNLGQSELRPEWDGSGVYRAVGANLSTVGRWRIRMTLQRPGQFDTVTDFELDAASAPPPVIVTLPQAAIPADARLDALILLGMGLLAIVGVTILQQRNAPARSGDLVLAAATLLVGVMVALAFFSALRAVTGR